MLRCVLRRALPSTSACVQVSRDKGADCPHATARSIAVVLGSEWASASYAASPDQGGLGTGFVFLRSWVSPRASFRPHLAVTPLPPARGWGCRPPQRTFTSKPVLMPGVQKTGAPKGPGPRSRATGERLRKQAVRRRAEVPSVARE